VKDKLNVDTAFNQAEVDKKDYFNPIFNQKPNTTTGVKRNNLLSIIYNFRHFFLIESLKIAFF